MKQTVTPKRADYRVYIEDTDGSERLGCIIYAAESKKQARRMAPAMMGVKLKITSVEIVSDEKY